MISYTWSWSNEIIQILSLIGTYSLSLISITFFCLPFLFFKKKNYKKNIFISSFFLIIFIGNYYYGVLKLKNIDYTFDKNISIKIISPNFLLKEYKDKSEEFILKRLIKISDPSKDKRTLFIWPEGILWESYLSDLKKYRNNFVQEKKYPTNYFYEKNNVIFEEFRWVVNLTLLHVTIACFSSFFFFRNAGDIFL